MKYGFFIIFLWLKNIFLNGGITACHMYLYVYVYMYICMYFFNLMGKNFLLLCNEDLFFLILGLFFWLCLFF